jgi:hypothetical protein
VPPDSQGSEPRFEPRCIESRMQIRHRLHRRTHRPTTAACTYVCTYVCSNTACYHPSDQSVAFPSAAHDSVTGLPAAAAGRAPGRRLLSHTLHLVLQTLPPPPPFNARTAPFLLPGQRSSHIRSSTGIRAVDNSCKAWPGASGEKKKKKNAQQKFKDLSKYLNLSHVPVMRWSELRKEQFGNRARRIKMYHPLFSSSLPGLGLINKPSQASL